MIGYCEKLGKNVKCTGSTIHIDTTPPTYPTKTYICSEVCTVNCGNNKNPEHSVIRGYLKPIPNNKPQ